MTCSHYRATTIDALYAELGDSEPEAAELEDAASSEEVQDDNVPQWRPAPWHSTSPTFASAMANIEDEEADMPSIVPDEDDAIPSWNAAPWHYTEAWTMVNQFIHCFLSQASIQTPSMATVSDQDIERQKMMFEDKDHVKFWNWMWDNSGFHDMGFLATRIRGDPLQRKKDETSQLVYLMFEERTKTKVFLSKDAKNRIFFKKGKYFHSLSLERRRRQSMEGRRRVDSGCLWKSSTPHAPGQMLHVCVLSSQRKRMKIFSFFFFLNILIDR
jgi:hypothetical protein